jgi:hypothetical protein
MKPAELRPLVGRKIEIFLNGQRTAQVVSIPASDALAVKLAGVSKARRISIGLVAYVHWRGKRISIPDYLARRKDDRLHQN